MRGLPTCRPSLGGQPAAHLPKLTGPNLRAGGRVHGGGVRIPFWFHRSIAFWYADRMTVQVAVRMPDAMVNTIDGAVARGWVANRSNLVITAVERELRRLAAENDLRIINKVGPKDDLDDLVSWSCNNSILPEF